MEIEAKFAVPDRQVYRRLARLRTLAGFALAPAGVGQVADRYFDTADARLLAGGYACRLRTEGEVVVATLKGLGGVAGAVHRRAEHEVCLPAWDADPAAWPAGPARSLAQELSAGAPLRPLFELNQRRARADVLDGARRVAQFSLDAVRVAIGGRPTFYYELEVELTADGTEADLAQMVGELRDVWGLVPEPRSKFERGLALWQAHRAELAERLTADERRQLQAHAASGDPDHAPRAALILAWADGAPLREIAARGALSIPAVRYRLRTFRAKRLSAFGGSQLSVVSDQEPAVIGQPSSVIGQEPAVTGQPSSVTGQPSSVIGQPPPSAVHAPRTTHYALRPPTIEEFCAAHGVDMAHARFVARRARTLFGALRRVHGLAKRRRKLLRMAALLNTVGEAADPAHPGRAGRDLILSQPLRRVDTDERLTLACIVANHRPKPRPDREPTLAALSEKLRRDVAPLAALLRMAEALDDSRTQAALLGKVKRRAGGGWEVAVSGSAASADAIAATAYSDLWRKLFGGAVLFAVPAVISSEVSAALPEADGNLPLPVVADVPAPAPTAPPPLPPEPLRGDEPMSEAGRKVLAPHFAKMLANEAGSRLGTDIEAVHDMRVATRRMRAAFALFTPYYSAKVLRPLGKGLRSTGRTLGAVRDLDVLLEKGQAYAASLPADQPGALEPLLAHWRKEREDARAVLLAYLDGDAYRRFCAEFGAFLATPANGGSLPLPSGAPIPYEVRHTAPGLILGRYQAVRAFESVLPGAPLATHHLLRIESKGLRYALEFFRDALGPEAPGLIKQVTALQDVLGALQDACVAEALLVAFLADAGGGALPGVAAYLAAQRIAQTDLLAQFPAVWSGVVGYEFRKSLGLALAAL